MFARNIQQLSHRYKERNQAGHLDRNQQLQAGHLEYNDAAYKVKGFSSNFFFKYMIF